MLSLTELPDDSIEFGTTPEFTGYRYDLENAAEISYFGNPSYEIWKSDFPTNIEWPEEIDPRSWFDIHNQGRQGSCQGQALADSVEYAVYLDTGTEIQISRSFAYLGTQEFDGLLGRDSGSTLAGGTKAAARGLPLESVVPYTDNYREALSRYRSQKDSILSNPESLYKLDGAIPLRSEEDCYNFLRSRSGIIQIGIAWTVPNAWEIKSYRGGGGGGHSVNLAGILKVASWGGRGYLLKNSWGEGWGRNGWALVHPNAISSMLKTRFTVFVGRSKSIIPKPKIHTPDL